MGRAVLTAEAAGAARRDLGDVARPLSAHRHNAWRNSYDSNSEIWVIGSLTGCLRKSRLLGISKRGNIYLRKLLIHGARAAMPTLSKSATQLGNWLRGLLQRAHPNTVVVALANKLARIAWAVMRSGEAYRRQGGAA